MADKKNIDPNMELVPYTLDFDPNPLAEPQQFWSFNFHNYLIKPGVEVRIPLGLKKIIEEQKAARLEQIRFIREQELKESR